jgi:hypothetical protein
MHGPDSHFYEHSGGKLLLRVHIHTTNYNAAGSAHCQEVIKEVWNIGMMGMYRKDVQQIIYNEL